MGDLELTRRERRELEACLRTASDVCVYRKVLALLEIDRQTPVPTVASLLHVHRTSVYRWVETYAGDRCPAALAARHHGGYPRFWSEEAERVLREALQRSPDTCGYLDVNWTVPLLCAHIEKVCGQKPSDRQVRQHMRQMDYVWKRPRHALDEPKSPRVRRRLRLIRKKVQSLPEGCAKLFEDETDLLLFPPIRAGWFLRGKPATVPISGENAKRVIFGTIDVETGHRVLISRNAPCAVDFQALLRTIRKEYSRRKVVLLLDKASRHTAQTTIDLAAELNIEFIWLPPRTTNVNPMDRLWRWGKDKICANKQYASIDQQADRFIEYLLGLPAEEARRKAGFLSGRFWLFRGKGRVANEHVG